MKILNKRFDKINENSVYIGRPSKWGNPFTHLDKKTKADIIVSTRKQAIKKYKEYILQNKELMKDLHELKNKDLVCWCSPKDCHGDILKELVEKMND